MDPQYLTVFEFFDLFCHKLVQNPGHKMAAGPSHLRQHYIRDVPADTCDRGHPRQRYIRDVADDTCARSHPRQRYIRDVADDKCAMKWLALWVMHRQREVNGMHVCKYGNLMRQEGSE